MVIKLTLNEQRRSYSLLARRSGLSKGQRKFAKARHRQPSQTTAHLPKGITRLHRARDGPPMSLHAFARRKPPCDPAKADRGSYPEDFYVKCGSRSVRAPSPHHTIIHADPLASLEHLHIDLSTILERGWDDYW